MFSKKNQTKILPQDNHNTMEMDVLKGGVAWIGAGEEGMPGRIPLGFCIWIIRREGQGCPAEQRRIRTGISMNPWWAKGSIALTYRTWTGILPSATKLFLFQFSLENRMRSEKRLAQALTLKQIITERSFFTVSTYLQHTYRFEGSAGLKCSPHM